MTSTRSCASALTRIVGRARMVSGLVVLVSGMFLVTLCHVGLEQVQKLSSRMPVVLEQFSEQGPRQQSLPLTTRSNGSSPPENWSLNVTAGQEMAEKMLPIREPKRFDRFKDQARKLDPTWTKEKSVARRKVMRERQKEVKKKCQRLHFPKSLTPIWKRVYDNFIWSTKYNLVWCPILKAASTTWVKHFLLLAGVVKVENGLHKHAKEIYKPPRKSGEQKDFLKKAWKLMIVRHPLQRLLSAYRDKMLRNMNDTMRFKILQRKIASEYYDPYSPDNSLGSDTSTAGRTTNPVHPTFTQFLMRVRDDLKKVQRTKGTTVVNPHWRPYWLTCAPCDVTYDLIARVETLDEDQEFIIRELGLQDVLMNVHAHSSNFDMYSKTSEATKLYYSQVPLSLLKDVVHLYRYDFEIFDYSPESYYSLARPDED